MHLSRQTSLSKALLSKMFAIPVKTFEVVFVHFDVMRKGAVIGRRKRVLPSSYLNVVEVGASGVRAVGSFPAAVFLRAETAQILSKLHSVKNACL